MFFRSILLTLVALPGLCSEEITEGPRPRWDFSFAVRGWPSNAGSSFTDTPGVFSEGDALAPGLELGGIRNRLMIRVTYQFPTVFRGHEHVFDNSFDHAVEREDTDAALGWELGHGRGAKGRDFVYRGLVGYKSLAITEDDLTTTDIDDDFQRRWQGPFVGISSRLRGTLAVTWDWDLEGILAYAHLDTQITEKMAINSSTTAPYRYDSNGFYLDLTFNVYLPIPHRDIQLMLGYKGQWYRPGVDTVRVRRVNPTRDGEVIRVIDVLTREFEAEGLIAGIAFKF